MPFQNRVTPFGEIVAIDQRGIFTGNRGIIHDPATKTLSGRRWTTKAWLICTCDYKGRRREIMGGRSWTELFFLDEAIALAAGHRPCFFCRRPAAEAFRLAWSAATNRKPSAPAMDAVLHRERLEQSRPPASRIDDLPDGAVVMTGSSAYTVACGQAFLWTESGYIHHANSVVPGYLLTPPSTLSALRSGYRPVLHPAIPAALERAQHS
jgi:hypothetical protein